MNKNISYEASEIIKPTKSRKPRPTVEVLCTLCGKQFSRQEHHHNYAVKLGQDEFCSQECKRKHRITSVSTFCTHCSKSLIVCFGEYTKSINKHFFCDSKCSASFNNRHRAPRRKERTRIVKGVVLAPKVGCLICNKLFKQRNSKNCCCSVACYNIYRLGVNPINKDDVINSIVNYFLLTNATPTKRTFKVTINCAAKRFFGSWNKAIESCGFKPNGNSPKNVKIKCRDGHFVRSVSEKIIDEWFFAKGINHEIGKPYQEGHYTCDFYLPDHDLWIEYFGLAGAFKEYDDTILVKNELVKKYNLNFIALFPKDLYPELNLDKIILL
jgi:hypothetical protein